MKMVEVKLCKKICENMDEIRTIVERIVYDNKSDTTTIVLKSNPKICFSIENNTFIGSIDFSGVYLQKPNDGDATRFEYVKFDMPLNVLTGNLNSED